MKLGCRYQLGLGLLLTAGSIIFLLYQVGRQWEKLRLLNFDFALITHFGLAVLLYFGALFFLVLAWNTLVTLISGKTLGFKLALSIYARSQFAKYLPGNVMHLAGRHWLGRKSGISHTVLVGAALGEVAGLVGSALFLGLLVYLPAVSWKAVVGSGLVLLVILIFGLPQLHRCLLRHLAERREFAEVISIPRSLPALVTGAGKIVLLYLGFFCFSGLAYLVLVLNYNPVGIQAGFELLSRYVLSWLTGLLTPGSSAGIGVRDALLVTVSSRFMVDESICLLVVFLFRLTTIVADILFFALSFIPFYELK